MLFINKCYLSRFSSYQSSYVKANGTELVFNNIWGYAYADYYFPEIVKKEIWATALIHRTGEGNHSRIGIGVKFTNGAVDRASFHEKGVWIPYASGNSTGSQEFPFNSNLPSGKYSKIRFHLWVDKDDNKKLCAEFFIADKRIPINGQPYQSKVGSSPIEGFT